MKKEELAVLLFCGKEMQGFKNWIRAAAHICDHLLTRPEMEDWCALADILKPRLNTNAPFEEARRMWSDDGDEEFRRYYAPYIAEIALALSSGGGEKWVGAETGETGTKSKTGVRVLGINGVLVIMEAGCVITAYLPGSGIRAAREFVSDEEELRRRRVNPLPREKEFSDARQSAAKEYKKGKKAGASSRPDTLSEMEKKLRIFKKSAKNVRTNDVNWYSMNRMNLKRLTLEEWEELYVRYAPANEKVDNEH